MGLLDLVEEVEPSTVGSHLALHLAPATDDVEGPATGVSRPVRGRSAVGAGRGARS